MHLQVNMNTQPYFSLPFLHTNIYAILYLTPSPDNIEGRSFHLGPLSPLLQLQCPLAWLAPMYFSRHTGCFQALLSQTTYNLIWTLLSGHRFVCKINSRSISEILIPIPSRLLFYRLCLLFIFINQFSSVAQSCPTICDPMNRSTPGLPVHHQLLWNLPKTMSIESVMPSSHLILCHPLLLLPSIFPSIMIFSNESALRIRSQSIGVSASKSVLSMKNQDWSPLGWTGWISLQSKGLSKVFSNTTVQKH